MSSSVCLFMLSPPSTGIIEIIHEFLRDNRQNLPVRVIPNTRAAAGWILFLSLVVFMYQIFAIYQLFVYTKLLYIKIPVGKSLWYLFPLIVSAI